MSHKKYAMTLQEGANYIGISKWKLLDLVHRGIITAKRYSRRNFLVRTADLEEWIDRQKEPGVPVT